jgi:tetratricopeptide (TPR) repeat protein
MKIYKKIGEVSEKISLRDPILIDILVGEDVDIAIKDLKKNIELLDKMGLTQRKTYTIVLLGQIYLKKGDLENAEKYCRQAFDLSREFGFKDITAGRWGGFGVIYKEKGMWSESIENFQRCIKAYNELGMITSEGEAHYDFGRMWKAKGDLEEAKTQLNNALKIFKKFNLEKKMEKVRKELDDL